MTVSKRFDSGYIEGMEAGDMEMACMCIGATNTYAFFAGVPLDLVVKDAEVEITFDPPWTQDLMSEEAKLELGFL